MTTTQSQVHDTIPIFTSTQDLIFASFNGICILFSMILFFASFCKKQNLKTKVESYCVISLQLLHMVTFSMLLYAVFHANRVVMVFKIT